MKIRYIQDIAMISESGYDDTDTRMIVAKILYEKPKIRKILKKATHSTGEERISRFDVIFGDRSTEIEYKEGGCNFIFDINKTYFSFSLSGERRRIANEIKNGENILCLFAGVGPFPIILARQKKVDIVAIEKNCDAFYYLLKNIEINRLRGSIKAINDDVENLFKYVNKNSFDRVIAPAPKIDKDFSSLYIDSIKKETGKKIYLYDFSLKDEIDRLRKIPWVLNVKKCGSYSPRVYRTCIEIDIGLYYKFSSNL
ncbi:MAG: hypothetical protein EF806_05960 [Candidatus Methanoliparum thermophilum]|uniref:SAM-dependent methyltransferase TRM5/TYW2-type domain-containing protein n=1 Tax=Methanoliparum thermophilum TaxID=2491083 RepID=A0A520KQX3_METT2|nr:hypothetical protein [Candidatus Methanoliparum sp. LAM-1]RZN63966.1 MAG: hypothetical protein EF806_05960 [Candidatus Methanoliparum thermophilum]